MQESDGSRDDLVDFRPHMPGELVETPTVDKSPSGYASSNDDEFSDAREGPQTPTVELGDAKEAVRHSSNTDDAEAKALEPLAPDAAQTPSNDLSTDVPNTDTEHVPGAFDVAEDTMPETATTTETGRDDDSTPKTATAAPAETAAPQPAEPATPVETPSVSEDPETQSPVKQQSPAVSLPIQPTPPDTPAQPAGSPAEPAESTVQPLAETTTPQPADAPSVPSTIVTDVNGETEAPPVSAPLDTPDLEVKWNSHGERIPRKVKEEVTKFEQLMEAEKARNRTPSPASLRSARSAKSKSPTRDLPLRDYTDAEPEAVTEQQTMSAQDIDDIMPPPSPSLLPAPKSPRARRRSSAASRARSLSSTRLQPPVPGVPESERAESVAASDGFGDDDFDDFGETVEGEEFDDFEGFEDGDAANDFADPTPAPAPQAFLPQIPVPILDFSAREKYADGLSAAVDKMFPPPYIEAEMEGPTSVEGIPFLTERSLSLWNQLVAPPPLQPPNWKVSRIRRLFLVSLGIPVDLDEILPAKRQKKLVLPSLKADSAESSNPASQGQSRSGKKQKDGDFNPNVLDISAAKMLCSTSEEAMRGMTGMELLEHVNKLEHLTQLAGDVLAYWLKKRDGAVGEKEAFETVIESLVGYARKKRQNG